MQTPSVDRRYFLNVIKALEPFGADVASLCLRRGLVNPLDELGDRLSLDSVSAIYDAIVDESGDPEFVYKVTNQANLADIGTLFQLVSCCSTLFDAMRLVCRYSSITSDVVMFSFHERGNYVDLLVAQNREVYVSCVQLESTLFLLAQYRRMMPAGTEPLLLEAWFMHAPRFPVAHYENYFGCRVLFNQRRNGVRLLRSTLEIPLPGADERRQAYYRELAERYEGSIGAGEALPTRVQRLYVQRMAFGEPDRVDIARALNVSVRTLQRKLREGGVSYRELIDQARLIVAKQELIAGERPVHEVALLVGYADVRSFRRAFLRWTGFTPAKFRCVSPA